MSDDELSSQVDTLSAKFEAWLAPKRPWTSSKMTAGRLEAHEEGDRRRSSMTVEEVEGSFKLNQHKSEADYAAIASALLQRHDEAAQTIAQRWSRCGRPLDYKHHPCRVSAE